MKSLSDLFRAAVDITFDLRAEIPDTVLATYWRVFRVVSIVAITAAILLLALPIIGYTTSRPVLGSLYTSVVAVTTAAWLYASFPLVAVAKVVTEEQDKAFAPIRTTVRRIGAALFWLLLSLLSFSLFPSSTLWLGITYVGVVFPLVALGISKFATSSGSSSLRLVMLYGLLIVAFLFLGSHETSVTLSAWLDSREQSSIEKPEGEGTDPKPPQPPTPKPIPYDSADPESIRAIQFVDAASGKPRIWYAQTFDGKYDLFNNGGFHPVEFVELQPVTQTVVQDILKLAAEEQRQRKEAAEKKAEQEAAKKRAEEERKREQEARQPKKETVITEVTNDPPPNGGKGTLTRREGPPRVLVLAGDESDSPWTTNITAEQLERAFVLSSKLRTVLRSEIPAATMEELSGIPLHDLARLSETAQKIGVRYVVIGTCLEATEQQDNFIASMPNAKFRTTVRIQMLDAQTGDSIYSRGFQGREYTKVLGGAPVGGSVGGAEGAYRKKMKEFASQFVRVIDRSDLNTR